MSGTWVLCKFHDFCTTRACDSQPAAPSTAECRLRRVALRCLLGFHGSILSGVGASGKPGAVQIAPRTLPPYARRNGVSRMRGRKRRLAGILAADVAGYSAVLATDEPTSLAFVRALRTGIVEPAAAAHAGRLFETMGDGPKVAG